SPRKRWRSRPMATDPHELKSAVAALVEVFQKLSRQEKILIARELARDPELVDAIVRHSHWKRIIDLRRQALHDVAQIRLATLLREELNYRKAKRDRKPDRENVQRDSEIRAQYKAGKTTGQLARGYGVSRQRIQQIVRKK